LNRVKISGEGEGYFSGMVTLIGLSSENAEFEAAGFEA
jgi:hypothetical protein